MHSRFAVTHETYSFAIKLDYLAWGMYFEHNCSSRVGMIVVGRKVVNLVHSDAFPNTICSAFS